MLKLCSVSVRLNDESFSCTTPAQAADAVHMTAIIKIVEYSAHRAV